MCTENKIKIMQAYLDGKEIEFRCYSCISWNDCTKPTWNWGEVQYRIKELIPDYINWDHVSPKYKYIARDSSNEAYAYLQEPVPGHTMWFSDSCSHRSVDHLSSYKQGDVDWKDSLIKRPD